MSISLIHGDCLEKMKDLSNNSIDLFICDLPYGCLKGPSAQGCSWDVPIDLDNFWIQIKRLSRNDSTPVLMCCSAKFGNELINSNPSWFRYDLIWNKTNAVGFLQANKSPMRSHELIYVFSKKGAYYNRKDIIGDFPPGGGGRSSATFIPSINGMPNSSTTTEGRRCVTSVITIANKKIKGGHPTQKPSELYKWLYERYCPAGGTILDPTAGSFTSCFVAREMGLHAIGIEKDNIFFKNATDKM